MKRSTTVSRRHLMRTLGLLAAATSLGGCWGSFSLTGKVYDWNGTFDSKWASWGIFLVFIILPVYGTLLFLDAVIFNTIEFFSGNNPIKRTADLGDGKRMVFTPVEGDKNAVDVEHYEGDTVVRAFRIHKTKRGFSLRDAKGERLRSEALDGGLTLRDANGDELASLAASATDRATADVEDGAAPSDAVVAVLDSASMGRMLAISEHAGLGRQV